MMSQILMAPNSFAVYPEFRDVFENNKRRNELHTASEFAMVG